jgi:hypothetical protein
MAVSAEESSFLIVGAKSQGAWSHEEGETFNKVFWPLSHSQDRKCGN